MGWIHPEMMCMMHPDEKQHPGICSSCLREKLKQLPAIPFATNQPFSPTAFYSSSTQSSVCASPTSNRHAHHRRVSSTFAPGPDVYVINGKGRMGKSHSVRCIKRKRVRNGVVEGKKKEGFWSKLIRSTSLKTRGVFVHSKHAKE